ncbi:TonB-dependent receptor [Pseudoalteromonas umbrosa]|uniref:TonB-dependent receptor n=1 Tax=Pseudoalteromonas umbrosa TaxID=3048489 RepID=UPI0024C2FB99|nr:TonB-dependent receptor [Pseudoalteromonas sp. B95]MDK1286032.1 TonB-dependent receptor [Pseudoalteromonas sp. B95]
MLANNFKKSLLAANIGLALTAGVSGVAVADSGTQVKEDVEVIEVRGIRRSLEASLNTKRFATSVVDSVSAEDIGKFPDKNVAETLQRIPGVSISRQFGEGSEVSIRGASKNLTLTTLNGQSVASTGWYTLDPISRSFNYSMLPSELISGVDVFKGSQADLVEGGVGGSVNVKTRKPLDLEANAIFASVEGQYSGGSEEWDPQVSGLYSWKDEDEKIGFLIAAAKQDRTMNRKGVEAAWQWAAGEGSFYQEREREAINFTAQYRPTDSLELGASYLSLELGANNVNTAFWYFPNGDKTTATGPSGAVKGGFGGHEPLTWLYPTQADGTAAEAYLDVRPRSATMKSDTFDFNLKYEGDSYTITAQVGTTDAEGGTNFESNYTGVVSGELARGSYDATGKIFQFGTPNSGITNGDLLQVLNQTGQSVIQPNTDKEDYFQADIKFDVDYGAITAIKTGVRFTDHKVTQTRQTGIAKENVSTDATSIVGQLTNGSIEVGFDDSLVPFFDHDSAQAHARSLLSGFEVDKGGEVELEEENFSAYVMADFSGEGFRGNLGVRYISTDAKAGYYGVGVDSTGAFQFTDWTYSEHDYNDVLPSANIVFDISEDVIVRSSIARVITRARYQEMFMSLGGFNTATDGQAGNESLDQGSIALEPFSATQFDVSYEWYFSPSSMFSLGYFHKNIDTFFRIDEKRDQQIGLNAADLIADPANIPAGCNGNTDCWTVNSFKNGAGGTLQGIEAQIFHDFDNGFGTTANYTFSDSDIDEENFSDRRGYFSNSSKHQVNVSAYYENDIYQARLSYNWRSEYMLREPGFYGNREQDAYGTLDFSAQYSVTEYMDLTFNVTNILEEDLVTVGNDNPELEGQGGYRVAGFPLFAYAGERRIVFGARFSF